MAIAGRILIIPKGNYNASATYSMLDAVTYNDALWLAKKTATGIVPSADNSEYWQKMIDVAGKQDTIIGGASTITENNLTASRALVSDASGKVAVSAVSTTELGYLDGATSNIQSQLNNHTHKYAGSSSAGGSATKAEADSQGQQINSTYIKGVTVSSNVMTVTKGNGTTSNITLTTGDDATVRYNATTDMVEVLSGGEWVTWKKAGITEFPLYQGGVNYVSFASYAGSVGGGAYAYTDAFYTELSITFGENINAVYSNMKGNSHVSSIMSGLVDLTNYDELKFEFNATGANNDTAIRDISVFITDSLTTEMTAVGKYNILTKDAQTSKSGEGIIDIRNLSGKHYIGINLIAGYNVNLTIGNMLLR